MGHNFLKIWNFCKLLSLNFDVISCSTAAFVKCSGRGVTPIQWVDIPLLFNYILELFMLAKRD